MQRFPVQSSNLQSVGYDESASILEIEFKDSAVYHYLAVPKQIFQGLMSARSKGSYLHQFIKDVFSYRQIR